MGVGPHASGRGWGPARNQIMLIESYKSPHFSDSGHRSGHFHPGLSCPMTVVSPNVFSSMIE